MTGLEILLSIPQQCQECGGGTRTEQYSTPGVVEWEGGQHKKLSAVKYKKNISIISGEYLLLAVGIYEKSIF